MYIVTSHASHCKTCFEQPKKYHCYWSKDYHPDFVGDIDMILGEFEGLDPDVEEWFAWDYVGDADGWGDYVTGGGVTINEFHRDSNVFDKIECENMTIKRVA